TRGRHGAVRVPSGIGLNAKYACGVDLHHCERSSPSPLARALARAAGSNAIAPTSGRAGPWSVLPLVSCRPATQAAAFRRSDLCPVALRATEASRVEFDSTLWSEPSSANEPSAFCTEASQLAEPVMSDRSTVAPLAFAASSASIASAVASTSPVLPLSSH